MAQISASRSKPDFVMRVNRANPLLSTLRASEIGRVGPVLEFAQTAPSRALTLFELPTMATEGLAISPDGTRLLMAGAHSLVMGALGQSTVLSRTLQTGP